MASISSKNSTSEVLDASATFMGGWEPSGEPDLMICCVTDQDGTVYIDFSNDGGATTHDTWSDTITGGAHYLKTFIKGPRSFRARYENGGTAQNAFSLLVSDGRFRANDPVTQEQMEQLLAVLGTSSDAEGDPTVIGLLKAISTPAP